MNNITRILSVTIDDVEFRCEETEHMTHDMRGEEYMEKRRSAWITQHGRTGNDRECYDAWQKQETKKKLEVLRRRLWRDEEGYNPRG